MKSIEHFSKNRLRCWAEVDTEALIHNFRIIQSQLKRGIGIVPAVKANAYGHGVGIVAPILEREGVAMFGVANLNEALELKSLKVRSPLLLLSGCLKTEVEEVVCRGFRPVISTVQEMGWFEKSAKHYRKKIPIHLKIDTGMGRLGVWYEQVGTILEKLKQSQNLILEGVLMQFASSDYDKHFTKKQLERFREVMQLMVHILGVKAKAVKFHAANSAAILSYPETHFHMVRPGIALYGSISLPRWRQKLRPVMTWKARVSLVKEIGPGRTISYGALFCSKKRMRVVTITAGYGDGYPRSLSNHGKVIIGKKSCNILGRVTMDQMVVDVTSLPFVQSGDEVILMGKDLSADFLASMAGTISYEIFTGISQRVLRVQT